MLKSLFLPSLLLLQVLTMTAQVRKPQPFGPLPTENQLKWQDMEMYAFIHYSMNTYTDQESVQSLRPRLPPVGTRLQTSRYARHHLHRQTPLRLLHVAIEIYGI